ncbi:Nectarin-1-like protein, partial [Drosera capensis]
LDVGFITTANVLVSKHIVAGEVFVFPRGLVHFQKNNGYMPAAVIAAFNSQLAGTQSIAVTLFTSSPPVPDNVLTKAFQIGTKEVTKIRAKLSAMKSWNITSRRSLRNHDGDNVVVVVGDCGIDVVVVGGGYDGGGSPLLNLI